MEVGKGLPYRKFVFRITLVIISARMVIFFLFYVSLFCVVLFRVGFGRFGVMWDPEFPTSPNPSLFCFCFVLCFLLVFGFGGLG